MNADMRVNASTRVNKIVEEGRLSQEDGLRLQERLRDVVFGALTGTAPAADQLIESAVLLSREFQIGGLETVGMLADTASEWVRRIAYRPVYDRVAS